MGFKTKLGDQLQGVKKQMDSTTMRYLVYDIESIVDKPLLNKVVFPGEGLSDDEAFQKHIEQQVEKTGSSFPNAVFHMPVALAVAAVGRDFSLIKLGLLGHEEKTSRSITEHFWEMYNTNSDMTLVDFNGSGYDMRLMELWAFREGISITPQHFQKFGARYRFAMDKHLDLQDAVNNNGSVRFMGGLNLLAKLLNKPGKMDVQGDMVQELYDKGEITKIEDYCLGDTLDTYFVFLRWMVVQGQLTHAKEKDLEKQAFETVKVFSQKTGYLKEYLERCGV